MEKGSLVPGNQIFDGCGGHLGHVTNIILINFNFPIHNLVKNDPAVAKKSKFEF